MRSATWGAGAIALFFFWIDGADVKELFVTHALPKRDVVGKARLNRVVAAVAAIRRRFLAEGD